MHVAPPVRMTLAPDAAWTGFVSLVAALAGANIGAWAAMQFEAPTVVVTVLAGACAAAASLAIGRRPRSNTGVLAWDGSAWSWSGDELVAQPGRLEVMVDLGARMLVRLALPRPSRRARWLVISRRQALGAWSLWRTALLARPAVAADPLAPT